MILLNHKKELLEELTHETPTYSLMEHDDPIKIRPPILSMIIILKLTLYLKLILYNLSFKPFLKYL